MVPFASRRITLLAMTSLAFGLFMIDHSTPWLEPARAALSRFLLPVIELAHVPTLISHHSHLMFKTKQALIQDIANLEAEAAGRAFQLQRYAQLIAENQRLREVLELKLATQKNMLVAEVLMLRVTSLAHKMVIDKGAAEGVLPNSIVFDAQGIIGQIHAVRKHHSWVTLISDPEHRIPVELSRTGVRGVLQGMSHLSRLELSYIPETADVQIDDLVVTSGLGGRFPAGYPLARVTDISVAEHQSFAMIQTTPEAHLSQLRFLFVTPPLDVGKYDKTFDMTLGGALDED